MGRGRTPSGVPCARMTHEQSVALPGASFWWRATLLVLARPSLWWTALHQAARLARRRWWARPPFLPIPDRGYLRFRLETQYGSPAATDGPARGVDPGDVLTYLRWCREQERALRARARSGR